MAWRSSGTNNESMVDNLKRFGVIRTASVEDAFRKVDRRFFVPRNQVSLAHADQPLRDDLVHISAPHIYGAALEALELEPQSAQSFLNLGSGTGYLSCMVANMLGPHAVHVAVEVHASTILHAQESMAQWQAANQNNDVAPLPPLEWIHGNALEIDTEHGEALTGFDRIYIGATVPRRKLHKIAQLLRPGGILVGPVDDDLVKVMRVGEGSVAEATSTSVPRSLRGHPPMLSSDFSVQVLSGVRFANLVESPSLPTILPSRVWEPSQHARYPDSFRSACKEILLCAHAASVQPVRPVPTAAVNAAAILPRALWMEVLSYTTRDWFEKPRNTEELLRRRLKEEQTAHQQAEEARQRAEARVAMMERERDLYKLLLLRCQTRLRAALGDAAMNNNLPEEELLMQDDEDEEIPRLLAGAGNGRGGFFRTLRLFQQSATNSNDNEDEDESQEDVDLEESDDDSEPVDMMEDRTEVNEDQAMEEDTGIFSVPAAAAGGRQVRTVSISGGDY